MGGAGGKADRVIRGVGRFQADHLLPSVAGHVGHAPGLVNPGIPDHGTIRAALLDDDAAVPNRVENRAGRLSAQVNLIRLFRDSQGLAVQPLAFESVGLIDKDGVFKP